MNPGDPQLRAQWKLQAGRKFVLKPFSAPTPRCLRESSGRSVRHSFRRFFALFWIPWRLCCHAHHFAIVGPYACPRIGVLALVWIALFADRAIHDPRSALGLS